jgi:hypothetical protein
VFLSRRPLQADDYLTLVRRDPIIDIRFIVLAFNRADSLRKCLKSLNAIELDGHAGSLEIFIDRAKDGRLHNETVRAAEEFIWHKGIKSVRLQKEHVGIYGQWIDSWVPRAGELAIIIEDDVDLSPFAFRWLRITHQRFGHLNTISGYCLQNSNFKIAKGKKLKNKEVNMVRKKELKRVPAFFYRVSGSWGLAPHPERWKEFRQWFHSKAKELEHPYVANAPLNTEWYKVFEKRRFEDSMWTMWYIYFNDMHKLSALVSNVPQYTGLNNVSLVCNRRESGLHFKNKQTTDCRHLLMSSWVPNCAPNATDLPLVSYNGDVTVMKIH